LHQGFALAASANLRTRPSTAWLAGGSGNLAGLGGFVGVNRAEFAIDVGELGFQLMLLVENLLSFSM
jgi:hypothetical protein